MSWLTEPDEDWDTRTEQPKSRVKLIALILGGWLAVSLLVLVGLLAFGSHPSSKDRTGSGTSTTGSASSSPSSTPTDTLPDGWVQQASDDQTDCAAHSYGEVKAFFAKNRCSSVHRTLATTNQGGRTVVVASNVVTFDTAAQARKYLALVNSDGTGNISDLLREGTSYPGAPSKLPAAAFASAQQGTRVLVSEAGYVQGTSNPEDATLKKVAEQAVTLD